MNLKDFGWNSHFQKHSDEHRARLENELSFLPGFYSRAKESIASFRKPGSWAETAGALIHQAPDSESLPACGDWVLADEPEGSSRTVVRFLLPRRTSFFRKQAGTSIGQQVVAANIDTVCLVSGLDADFNPRRIERYLAIAWESGARPVIVLNKADICTEVSVRLRMRYRWPPESLCLRSARWRTAG